ncbi:UPF0489 domain-containing protein [Paenibacillus sp. UNCCL117]|uniref:UPF0489 family protein n=1 Tax=unclassified Paenibacillus TaxID=185978 RepID=UPI00088EB2C7|nr:MULTISPECIES: UPF0489 family protein [unclassified Paenibacillus]SDC48143.1 UPF0489 domain-containing protein [Paenibacillus sp. cl123]SFW11995.1 UPF0489 domain-containing protein [Paenibacillus sp. UNCCL117]
MIEWEKDINWKLRTKDRRVYLMRDHNWSFAAWEIAKIDNRIKEKSLVVHVDSHLDDVADGALVTNLLSAKTVEEIMKVSESYDRSSGIFNENNIMHIDNFIWASIARRTIEEVIYVSRDKQEVTSIKGLKQNGGIESRMIMSNLPFDCNYRHLRYHSIESFLMSFNRDNFTDYVSDRTAILDLDIDVFNESDRDPMLAPMHVVRESVESLLNLYPWDIITIAISPDFCGGVLEAEFLLENVLGAMKLDVESMEKW